MAEISYQNFEQAMDWAWADDPETAAVIDLIDQNFGAWRESEATPFLTQAIDRWLLLGAGHSF